MQTNKILLINGHPDKNSFCFAIADAYIKGAKASETEIKVINIRDLNFNPNLQYGYQKRTDLEQDLLDAQDMIKWANHLV